MKIVTPRNLRENLKMYLDKAEQEDILIYRGKKGESLLLMKVPKDYF